MYDKKVTTESIHFPLLMAAMSPKKMPKTVLITMAMRPKIEGHREALPEELADILAVHDRLAQIPGNDPFHPVQVLDRDRFVQPVLHPQLVELPPR